MPGAFAIPYGRVYDSGIEAYINFSSVHRRQSLGIQILMDAGILVSAACIAISDPLSVVNGLSFLSLFSVDGSIAEAGRGGVTMNLAMQMALKKEISQG